MVSSELVVLLIVCVSTGSTQDYCIGDGPDISSCLFIDFFNGTDVNRNNDNSTCVQTTLNCESRDNCTAEIKGLSRQCNNFIIGEFGVTVQPIECCSCNSSNGTLKWWDCNTVPPSTPPSTDMCQDGSTDNTSCFAFSDHVNSSCVSAVLKCDSMPTCVAHIRDAPAVCIFNEFQGKTIEASITCCPCNGSDVFPSPWWDCNTPSSTTALSQTVTTSDNTLPVTMATVTTSTFPAVTMTPDELNIITVIAPVVVVLVVCLLLVCVIATIIILYQRDKHKSPQQQEPRKSVHEMNNTNSKLPIAFDNGLYNHIQSEVPAYDTPEEKAAPVDYTEIPSDGLYSHTSHDNGHITSHQLPPPIYSTLAEERGATDEYTVITERDRLAGYGMIGDTTNVQDKEEAPAYYSTVPEGAAPCKYSVITEATNNTNNEGLVYSAVVRKDGKKTTVKTTVQNL